MKITVRNPRRVPLQAVGQFFPPRADTVVDVDEVQLRRLAAKRGLQVLGPAPDEKPAAPTRQELIARAKAVGVPAKGKSADLLAAVEAAEAAASAESTEEGQGSTEAAVEGAEAGGGAESGEED